MILSGLLRMRSPSLGPTDLGKVKGLSNFLSHRKIRGRTLDCLFWTAPLGLAPPLARNILSFLNSTEVDLHFFNNDFQQRIPRAMYNAFSSC